MALISELSAASPYSILPSRDKPYRFRAMAGWAFWLGLLTGLPLGDKLGRWVPSLRIGAIE